MSYADALSRISQIQQQMEALSTGSLPSSSSDSTSSSSTSTPSTDATSDFANALAQAQDGTSTTASGFGGIDDSTLATSADTGSGLSDATLASALGLSGGTSASASTGATLPASASSMLTSDQQQFASTLSADTGLNPGVVSAWLLAEESGGAAQSRQAQSNNDWLNIGYTDSGTYGSADSVWSDPVTAANATAGWLKGQDTIPDYGTASSSIQGILSTVGSSPSAQISALQSSGWASSGYPDLPELYDQVTG